MKTKESILEEMESKMDSVVFKYEKLFKASGSTAKDFQFENYENIVKELASIATDSSHQTIINGIDDKTFLESVIRLSSKSIEKLVGLMNNH